MRRHSRTKRPTSSASAESFEEVLGYPLDDEQWRRRTRSELLYKILEQLRRSYDEDAKIEEQAHKIKSLRDELEILKHQGPAASRQTPWAPAPTRPGRPQDRHLAGERSR
jgi:hypothetical protein